MNSQQLTKWIQDKIKEARLAQDMVSRAIDEVEARAIAASEAERKAEVQYSTAYLKSEQGTERSKEADAKLHAADLRHEMRVCKALHHSAQAAEKKARDDAMLVMRELEAARTIAATMRLEESIGRHET